ncbi:MAG TPA: DUF1295 domain-containing protein [Spirochaetia bacterium]|nr:DUF1295 domain-containing protein [Spirochaetia bacterium]
MIYGMSHGSGAQKSVMMIGQTVVLGVAVWLLLFGGLEAVSRLFHVQWDRAVGSRRVLLTVCFGVVFVRISVTTLYLLKRAMGWEEAISIPFAFMMYYLGFSLFAGPASAGFGAETFVGIVLFVVGSFLNTGSELLRDRWKKDPEHKGKLYTGGLFRYSMHINYFGDILWVIGLACMTANLWSAIIPALLFVFFAFYNAPMLDKHLSEKYGEEFAAYRRKTKRIIPFIF